MRCFDICGLSFVHHFLDDFIIPADTVDQMLERVEKYLRVVVKHRIKLSAEKCQWFKREITFLGYILSVNGVKKSPEYFERIKQASKPATVHEMMKFLGLVNFQRRFIPSCSDILAPLYEAIKVKGKNIKKTPVFWNDEMEEAFEKIKSELAKDVSLAFPIVGPDAPILQLYVDASNRSMGALLYQSQYGQLRPISFISKLFSSAELNYSSYDKEILAMVRGITAHNQFLLGRKFILYTDCKNIVYLFKMKHCCPRLIRLLEKLTAYDFTI